MGVIKGDTRSLDSSLHVVASSQTCACRILVRHDCTTIVALYWMAVRDLVKLP